MAAKKLKATEWIEMTARHEHRLSTISVQPINSLKRLTLGFRNMFSISRKQKQEEVQKVEGKIVH